MDKISKILERLSPKEQRKIREVLIQLRGGRFKNLDLKKLKGREDVFRVRKGGIRIIYRTDKKGGIFILSIEKRSDQTYNF